MFLWVNIKLYKICTLPAYPAKIEPEISFDLKAFPVFLHTHTADLRAGRL